MVSFFATLIIVFCCAGPLVWIAWQIVSSPRTLVELRLDVFRLKLLARTVGYNGCVALLTIAMATPTAIALGRGRGVVARSLWFVLPIALLMPSIVMAYGWKQVFRLMGLDFDPASTGDVARCVWSLAAWLWPLPAMLVGLALRRIDTGVQQQALLDGALWRVTFRQLSVPICAAAAMVCVLAVQEFAVYEPTGISVVATEVRMVFDTGAFASDTNPIAGVSTGAGGSAVEYAEQGQRAAASVAAALPLILVIMALSAVIMLGARKASAAEQIEVGEWPGALDAPKWTTAVAWALVTLTTILPIVAMIVSLHVRFDPKDVWEEFQPQLLGSIELASYAGLAALLLSLAACLRRSPWRLLVASLSFLVGGQLLAIALIRIYNNPALGSIGRYAYNGPPVIVTAYLARFAWAPIAAALATWSPPWRGLRDLAAVDGAGPLQTALRVVWPIASPLLLGAAMLVMILALTEVPATILISPQRPQPLVPMLMTWVHMLRYDDMIKGSLVLVGLVVVLGAVALSLGTLARRVWVWRGLVPVLMALVLFGCERSTAPEAIWCRTGRGPEQVVYPRGITYSPKTDTFFIVDRVARIQQLDRDGKFMNEWQMPEWAQGKPVGLTVGPDGNLYVPDTHYHRVMVYSPQGQLLRQWGSKGTEPGQFIYPTDIAFDRDGHIYVSEYGDNDRVQVFDGDGKYLRQFGSFGEKPGQFSRPESMVIDGETMYIADACNHRIDVFKIDGTFVRTMGKIGSAPGEFRFPYGLDMDADGKLIVCEFGNNRVQRIDKLTGKSLGTWGHAGRDPGELAYPWGVAVDKHNRVVAVDAGNNRLQVFEF